MGTPAAIALVSASYLLGCVTPSYYAVKWFAGRDLRESGSGNVGATNAGRILGKKAYTALALLDILKGWAAPAAAFALGCRGGWTTAAGLAVTAGHLWPVQLGGRGGKGMATAYGVILYFSPWTALAMWGLFLPGLALLRRTTLPAILAFLAAPVLRLAAPPAPDVPGMTALLLLALTVILTHRSNLRMALRRASGPRSLPSQP